MSTGNPSGKGLNFPLGSDLVPFGSPLHVSELFLQLLKLHFSDLPDGSPFKYIENDFENTKINFDVALNKESDIYGAKPLIVISRGQQSMVPTEIGDLAAGNFPRNVQYGSHLFTAAQNFNILSKSRPEVEVIGQIIFAILMKLRTRLPYLLNLHTIQSLMLSEATRMEDDDAMFMAQGMFTYMGQYIWKQTHDDIELRGVAVNTTIKN